MTLIPCIICEIGVSILSASVASSLMTSSKPEIFRLDNAAVDMLKL